jgi:hypothetical protein
MPLRSALRRRARRRQLAAAVVLACAGGGTASLLAVGPVAPVALQAQAQQVCITPPFGINCPAPTGSSGTAKPPPTSSHSGTGQPTSSGGGHRTPPPSSSGFSQPPGFSPPGGSPLPTLPPPSPGAPPEPPELSVQSILLQLASDPPSKPGGSALVQGTLEAQRDSDTYAVPHATVTFTVTSQPGSGADVVPAELDSGDTGVVLVTVHTGDRPGDTVVHAEAGAATADITVHTDAGAVASPTPRHPVAAGSVKNGPSDTRAYLVAALAALVVAVIAGYLAAMVLGRLPNPLQRRSVWGRKSGITGR